MFGSDQSVLVSTEFLLFDLSDRRQKLVPMIPFSILNLYETLIMEFVEVAFLLDNIAPRDIFFELLFKSSNRLPFCIPLASEGNRVIAAKELAQKKRDRNVSFKFGEKIMFFSVFFIKMY